MQRLFKRLSLYNGWPADSRAILATNSAMKEIALRVVGSGKYAYDVVTI